MIRYLLFVVMAVSLSACTTTRYIPAESVRTEYRDRTIHSIDTIADRQFVYVNGDTMFVYRDRWRVRQLHDTVMIATHDTIREPYAVEIPAKLSVWERTKVSIGGYALAISAIALGVIILYAYSRFRM